jgi:hypothetical protein
MITQERLHEMFEYRDGTLYRKKSLGRSKTGDKAGFVTNKGYIYINIDKKCIAAHRLIWVMQHGAFPELIDHIDGDRLNNRIENLRLADRFGNAQNKRMHKNNTSGVKGVYWKRDKNKWAAQITCNNQQKFLGCFASIDEANEAVSLARSSLHGQFANHGITTLTDRITALEAK